MKSPTALRVLKAFQEFTGCKVVKVEEDDYNIHLSFDNGKRIALAVENFNESDYICDDRPVPKTIVRRKRPVAL